MIQDTDQDIKVPSATQEQRWQLFVAQFQSTIRLNDEPEPIQVQMEIIVAGEPDKEQRLIIAEIRRFTIYSAPLDALHGSLSLIGPSKDLELIPGPDGLVSDFYTRIYYPVLNEWEPACQEADAVYPRLETLAGTLTWESEAADADGPMRVLIKLALDRVVEEVAGRVQRLDFESEQPVIFYLPHQLPPLEEQRNSLQPCGGSPPPGLSHVQRGLKVRFVSASTLSAASLKPWVQEWINSACKVWWAKGAIKIVPDPDIHPCSYPPGGPQGVVPAGQETGITACVSASVDATWMHVYLVDQLLGGYGGGATYRCGTTDAFILLEIDKAKHNKYLLAHELGHVLGLRHPGEDAPDEEDSCQSYREGSHCSVMLPSAPVSSRNTLNNIGVTTTNQYPLVAPVFYALPGTANWAPDPELDFFHIIRDFPYDDGSQSSVPEQPFANWWSHSDVWNSNRGPKERLGGLKFEPSQYADLGDMFNPDHSPVHADPHYIGSNWMYVRLHTCQPLSTQATPSVKVYLFLAVPGVSAASLYRLHPPPDPDLIFQSPDPENGNSLPLPAKPKTKWIQWTVPSQLPAHSCVFAVAVSSYDSPPSIIQNIIANPANFRFDHLANLLKSDNDVAQRNLYIQNATTKNLAVTSKLPWLVAANPFDEPVRMEIEIDAGQALGLMSLTLEVDGEPVEEIAIGELVHINLADSLAPEERRILRLRAALPADTPLGTTFPIDLRFLVNGEMITGYTHLLRVAPLEETVAQVLDQLYGALRAVQAAFGINVEALLARIEQSIVAAATDPGGALRDICRHLAPLLGQIARPRTPVGDEPEHEAVYESLAQLAALLESAAADDSARGLLDHIFSPNQLAERIRVLADRIQEPAGQLARRREPA